MSKYKPVTVSQAECVRKISNEKMVGRAPFQRALDNGTFARLLDSLKGKTGKIIAITPPPGARIRTVHVCVRQGRPWQDAVDAASSNTPSDYSVRKIGDLYPPTETGEVKEDIILLNYPKGDGDWNEALVWAKIQGLETTVPREVFAIGEQHPLLHKRLGLNPMCVVATAECSFGGNRQTCYFWWNGSDRKVSLRWIDNFGNSNDWFAFRKQHFDLCP